MAELTVEFLETRHSAIGKGTPRAKSRYETPPFSLALQGKTSAGWPIIEYPLLLEYVPVFPINLPQKERKKLARLAPAYLQFLPPPSYPAMLFLCSQIRILDRGNELTSHRGIKGPRRLLSLRAIPSLIAHPFHNFASLPSFFLSFFVCETRIDQGDDFSRLKEFLSFFFFFSLAYALFSRGKIDSSKVSHPSNWVAIRILANFSIMRE